MACGDSDGTKRAYNEKSALTHFVRDLSIHDQESSEHLQWETGSSYLKSFNPVYLHLGRQVKATLRDVYVCVFYNIQTLYFSQLDCLHKKLNCPIFK